MKNRDIKPGDLVYDPMDEKIILLVRRLARGL